MFFFYQTRNLCKSELERRICASFCATCFTRKINHSRLLKNSSDSLIEAYYNETFNNINRSHICNILIFACKNSPGKLASIESIRDPAVQDSLFRQLLSLTNHAIPENELNDSLAFLVLPMEASCPACRKKTVDSIVRHKNSLLERHYIILSASGGRKTINSYFIEEGEQLPEIQNKLFLTACLRVINIISTRTIL